MISGKCFKYAFVIMVLLIIIFIHFNKVFDESMEKLNSNTFVVVNNTEYILENQEVIRNKREAQALATQISKKLNLGKRANFLVEGSTNDSAGRVYYQLQQTYKNIPVIGASAVLEVKNGHAQTVFGGWVSQVDINVKPTFQPFEALEIGLIKKQKKDYSIQVTNLPILCILIADGKQFLSWIIEASVEVTGGRVKRYAVGANSPVIIIEEFVDLH
jgi:Zn-dependent metalloprotease